MAFCDTRLAILALVVPVVGPPWATLTDRFHRDIATQEQMIAQADPRAMAASQLARAMRLGAGFRAELAELRVVLSPQADVAEMLDAITPFAATGVPTLAALRRRFLDWKQGGHPGIPTSWPRAADDPSPVDPVTIATRSLAEADTLLRDDDLIGAMAALRRIEPRPPWVEAWLSDASACAAVDALLPRLDRISGTR